MQGRDFLVVAQELVAGTTEAHWRTAVTQAYYALMLECRDALIRWGYPPPPRHSVHADVRLRFSFATDPDIRQIGDALDDLVRRRNPASYDLTALPAFASSVEAHRLIGIATAALALLDAIEADPVRRPPPSRRSLPEGPWCTSLNLSAARLS